MSSSRCIEAGRFATPAPTRDQVGGPADASACTYPAMPGVGIVIPNYNNERFIGAAIDSALGQDYPDVHVVVVDDGSTDNSRALLDSYAERITLIFQANAGQLEACRRGVAALTTSIVIFLDSDDVLASNAASTVARAWGSGVSKIQYRLEVIDALGAQLGIVFPKYPLELSSQSVRRELLRTGAYICPPGLGNAYARQHLLALPETKFLPAFADALYATIAPLDGDVVTLPMTLGQYRIHGNSLWSIRELDLDKLARRRQVELERTAFLDEICRNRGIPFDLDRALGQLLSYQELSLALAKFGAKGWRSYPRTLAVLGDTLWAMRNSHFGLAHRLFLGLWACSVALLPRPLAAAALLQRMAPTIRWHWVERLVRQRAW